MKSFSPSPQPKTSPWGKVQQATQTAHTPGPWHIQAKAGRHYIQAANFIQVACMVRQAERAEIANNAALIAAAPDLLAALRDMLASTTSPGYPNTPTKWPDASVVVRARAALAKAAQS